MSTISALLTSIFHHAECDGNVCENYFMALFITLENDGSCVELHGFRGLYVSRMGEVIENGFVYHVVELVWPTLFISDSNRLSCKHHVSLDSRCYMTIDKDHSNWHGTPILMPL